MVTQSNAIELKVHDSVATVMLNRPGHANALTRAMIAELREMLRDLYQEKKVRAIVLTGAGDAFCGGRDAAELLGDPDAPQQENQLRWGEEAAEYRELIVEMLSLPKPIVAAVTGAAAAGGAGLVLASDIVVAANEAPFGLPDTRRGIVAGVVAPLMAFRLGAGPAARLALSGEMIDAAEAHRIGIYHETTDDMLVWARAVELGKQTAAGASEAVALTKRLLWETVGEHLSTQLTSGAIASAMSRTTESAEEGLRAFVENRDPEF